MKVHELAGWLAAFPDQDAEVTVIRHVNEGGHYMQGGSCSEVPFDPELHHTYTDMRGNPFVPVGAPYENARTLLLGEINA